MNPSPHELTERLARLRQSFDDTFAEPPRAHASKGQVLLAIQAGGMKLAVRLQEIAGIHPYQKTVPIPNCPPGLLGVAGLRGRLVAVYDLARLLGGDQEERPLRWILLASVDPHMALAIDALDSYVQVVETALHKPREGNARSGPIGELVEVSGAQRGIVSISSIVHAARQRTPAIAP